MGAHGVGGGSRRASTLGSKLGSPATVFGLPVTGVLTMQGALAGTSTIIAGSPTTHEVRKNSSYLHSLQSCMGPTPMRLAKISAPMPPVP